jgi:hypothetical protein
MNVPLVELCWQGRTCPSAISSNINPTRTDLKLNQSLRGDKPANNHLSHCTVGQGYRPISLVTSIVKIWYTLPSLLPPLHRTIYQLGCFFSN